MCAFTLERLYNLYFSFWFGNPARSDMISGLSSYCVRVTDLIIKYINSTQTGTLGAACSACMLKKKLKNSRGGGGGKKCSCN